MTETAESLPSPRIYGTFWSRFNAYGYDFLITQIIALVPMFLFFNFPTMEQIVLQADESANWFDNFTYATVAVSTVYNILFIASSWQATPGKRHCKLQVINADGSRLSLAQSAIRHIASGLGTVTAGLGFLPALFTAERTTLHDMICQTRVIRVQKS